MTLQRILPVGLFAAQVLGAAHPIITPAPSLEDRDEALARGFDPGSYINSVISGLGSDISSYVASGVPQFFQDFPIGEGVEEALDIDDDDLKATPTQALNIPGYANWTESGWSVRIHGNVYKQPNITQDKLNSLANKFLIGVDIEDLPENQQDQARNFTASIFVVQQQNVSVTVNFENDVDVRPDASGGVVNAKGGAQSIDLPFNTTSEGDFDAWLTLRNTTGANGGHLIAGNATEQIQALNVVCTLHPSPVFMNRLLMPRPVHEWDERRQCHCLPRAPYGIHRRLRHRRHTSRDQDLRPEGGAPQLVRAALHSLGEHARDLRELVGDHRQLPLPLPDDDARAGDAELHGVHLQDVPAGVLRHAAAQLLRRVGHPVHPPRAARQDLPDVPAAQVRARRRHHQLGRMKDYPQLVRDYPGQVQCIFLRNTTATDSTDLFPYDTSGFEGIDQKQYMFFVNADDLRGVDIVGGNCHNQAVVQNVTFGYQGRGFGNDVSFASRAVSWSWFTLYAGLLVTLGQVLL